MAKTLAFDIYGTLIDTQGVRLALQGMIGEQAILFSQMWRDKQLEYSFRRGLMRNYRDFAQCTRDALEYCNLILGTELDGQQKNNLLQSYSALPAFDDVIEGLETLLTDEFRLYAFSNGSHSAVQALLINAGIDKYFIDIISVDEIKSFKPDPDVYRHFLKRTGAKTEDSWLVSSNTFDITGAISSGMNAAWLQRSADMVFDPWDIQPTVTVNSMHDLLDALA